MKEIKLHYHIQREKKEVKTIAAKIPENWDECSSGQLDFLLGFRRKYQGNEGKIRVVKHLFDLKKIQLQFIPSDILVLLQEQIEWVYKDKKVYYNRYEKAHGLFGPGESLSNISLIQFVHAGNYIEAYLKDQNYLNLCRAVACLWLEKGKKYNLGDTEERAVKIKNKWTPTQVEMSVMYFATMKEAFINKIYYDVFHGDGESSEESNTDPWFSMMHGLATHGSLGTLEQVQNENIHNALMTWQEIIKSNKQLQKNADTTTA